MSFDRRILRSVLAAALPITALGGCIVAPAPRPYYAPRPVVYAEAPPPQAYYAPQVVTVEPPPPQPEVIGVAPVVGYVWIGGYWNWVGNRHVWVAGHWDAPRPGHVWVAHRWVRAGGGWRMAQGHWERR